MKNIILFDTSVGTMNHGDDIINISFAKNAKELLEGNFVVKYPTHTPCFLPYQQFNRNKRFRFADGADYKFIIGTNIISNHMDSPWPFWNINYFNSKCYKNSVLVGVGSTEFSNNSERMKLYSKKLFLSFLSKKFVHSVRDEKTKRILESIGLRAINTGCPTMWGLTQEHCSKIPTTKADEVVFTLTDYAPDFLLDQQLIDLLLNNYKKVYFWPQGTDDYNYFRKFRGIDKVFAISPDLSSYSRILDTNIDYIGTRLHAGIYALQHKKRSIILSVDNRARDMMETYNINVIERNKLSDIEIKLKDNFKTEVKINEHNIIKWKSQFK